MLRPLIFLLTILFTGVPGVAWADNVPLDRTITRINTYDKFAVIKFSPAFDNNLGCTGGVNATTRAALFFDAKPDNKVQLAMAMMAMSLKQKIGFGISGCSGVFGGIPIVYRVDIED